jgi:hypothetical protein
VCTYIHIHISRLPPLPNHRLSNQKQNEHTHTHTHTQILYFLSVQHAEALDAYQLAAFLHDVHASLPPLLAAQRSLLSSQPPPGTMGVMVGMAEMIGKLSKHLSRLVVELQKRAPLTMRGGLLPAFLGVFWAELEGAAK